MTARPLWRALCLLALLCTWSRTSSADTRPDPSAAEQEVTLSHIYKIDIPGSTSCNLQHISTQDETGLQMETTKNGNNDIIFRHNIKLQSPRCDCEESESFKSLLYRVNGLEEEVNYLKTQCAQGCCGAAGVDKSCSGHGTYQHDTCSCLCNVGWEGPDCSESSCPDECNDNGRCVDGRCVCHEGYTGEDCSELTCPDNCNDNGQCVDGQCVCYEGYTGEDCSELTCPNNCNDKGQCVDGKCVCFSHFAGEDCSNQKCPNDCTDNGQCVNGKCICDDGFYGEDCSLVLAPQGLQVVQVTDVSLLVEWESVQGAEYYVLTYYPKNDEGAQEQISVANTENSYLITGLTPGVTYIVQVHAVVKGIQSEADEIEATTDVSTIDGIRVLGQTEVSIEVDWQNPQAEMDYFRLTHTDPEGQEEELKVQRSQEARTKHTIVGLYPGTEYVISVQAIKGNNGGKASSVTGATDIDAPTNLVTTEVTEDTATVSWDQAQAGIEGYMLSYTSAEGSSSDISVARDSTSYRLIGLRPGVLHNVYIWAYKGDKVSGKSSTEAETNIDSPKDLRAVDVTLDSASLTWTPPLADIEGYILTYRDEEGNMETVEKQLVAGESSFAASSLEMGKRYIVTIIAYRGNKRSKVVETIFKTVGLLHPFPMDCVQIMKNGNKRNGVYTVYINNDRSKPIEAYCDMDTDGGGWLVLQRRNIGKLDFMKRWRQYIAGFGNLTEEFWIGLDKIYELTNTPTQYELRFDLGVGSERAYAVYDNFKIAPVKQKFKLTIGKYSGTAGDAMTYHQGLPWTTIDSDNDIALTNCALSHRGAWWYKNCHLANLNGKWGETRHSMGVNWEPWKGHLTSLDFSEMKIRPVGALSSRKRRSLAAREKSRNTKLQKK
ncbi:tenascin-N isoform X2 [Pundamilia nyererei]|uniref:Tenascin-N isoform X2 n=1 Tax=Pundamilia nyererei TaxID=303518 RepID=A0A9Y3QJF6_9CICH|nr:PREDICTED: tenascin-N isoform X2 [Pundamilia nyererei]